MMPATLAVTVMDSKARTVPTDLANLDDAAGLHRVDIDRRRARPRRAAAARARRPAAARAGNIGADHRHFRQMAALIGVPAAKACCPQHGNDGELTGHTHARSLNLQRRAWHMSRQPSRHRAGGVLAQYMPSQRPYRSKHDILYYDFVICRFGELSSTWRLTAVRTLPSYRSAGHLSPPRGAHLEGWIP